MNENDFIEILAPTSTVLPDRIIALVSRIDPRHCSSIIKELNHFLPLRQSGDDGIDLTHLRRVRRLPAMERSEGASDGISAVVTMVENEMTTTTTQERQQARKKRKSEGSNTTTLDILIGSCRSVKTLPESVTSRLISAYDLQPREVPVPGRSAQSKEELKEWNALWPTVYFHKTTAEYKKEELALTEKETRAMEQGMREAIDDAKRQPLPGSDDGVVVACPATGEIVSRSNDERLKQRRVAVANPLCTAALLAIQGVSRQERMVALGEGMGSDVFREGQYLCTGYDVYLTREPESYEAMALLHSRVRRVVYGIPDKQNGGLGSQLFIHCLPGTNHRYRAFCCRPGGELYNKCLALYEKGDAN